jgi:hypothetical protein
MKMNMNGFWHHASPGLGAAPARSRPTLFVSAANERPDEGSRLLGDAGLSLPSSDTRWSFQDVWTSLDPFPEKVRGVLESHRAFAGFECLVGLAGASDEAMGGQCAVLVLARRDKKLMLFAVTDAKYGDAQAIGASLNCAAQQAQRFCVSEAALVVHSRPRRVVCWPSQPSQFGRNRFLASCARKRSVKALVRTDRCRALPSMANRSPPLGNIAWFDSEQIARTRVHSLVIKGIASAFQQFK